jgi:hypothetical protein
MHAADQDDPGDANDADRHYFVSEPERKTAHECFLVSQVGSGKGRPIELRQNHSDENATTGEIHVCAERAQRVLDQYRPRGVSLPLMSVSAVLRRPYG